MSITIQRHPDKFSPSNQPIHWQVSTTGSERDRTGFSYFADLYNADGTVFIKRLKVPKRPLAGKGLLDVQPVLSSFIDNTSVPIGETRFRPAPGFGKEYLLYWGYWSSDWSFFDNYFKDGWVGFTSITQSHNFIIGDKVRIAQTTPFTNSTYEGIAQVREVPDEFSIIIDKTFGNSTGPEGGIIQFADARPIISSGLTSGSSTYWTMGMSISTEDFQDYSSNDYIHGQGSGPWNWMCNAPFNFRVRRDSQMFVPIRNWAVKRMLVFTYNADNSLLGSYEISNSYPYDPEFSDINKSDFLYVCCGPLNLTNSTYTVTGGPAEILNMSAASYAVGIDSLDGSGSMAFQLRFKLDDRCPSEDVISLIFCDKKGAWSTFSFTRLNDEKHRVDKTTYYKNVFGDINGIDAVYDPRDKGVTTIALQHFKEWTLRTDYLTDAEAAYLMELHSSPHVLMVLSDSQAIPVQIDQGDLPRLVNRSKEFVQYEISVSKSYSENVPL